MDTDVNPLSHRKWLSLFFGLIIIIPIHFYAQGEVPFFKDGVYEQGIPTPDEVLGFRLGERPVRYEEAIGYLRTLAEVSPRVKMVESGKTHEGRTLYYLLISSEANMSRLDEIQNNIATLADPRKVSSPNQARNIIDNSPAIAWMMYSIHGDELSGTDASLQLAYQLAAGADSLTGKIRRELVVGIDPMENPDGRERYLAQMQQWNGVVPNSDVQSMQHTGVWPWGRTNHYLFDLNRDWFILSQPESRARVQAIAQWNPQLIVDAHEMGAFSTFLFPPAREPINPNFSKTTRKWINIFAADHAKAFDRYGWSYYTREWLEDWFPGYASSMPFFIGAVGVLYEQASTDGSLVKRPDETILTFREAVHHQFVSSIANLTTAANNRAALLADFYQMRGEALSATDTRAYYIVPGNNPTRVHRLIERLLMQGIEVQIAEADFQAKNIRSYWDAKRIDKSLPKGTFIVRLDQPRRHLVNAILEFDPRMNNEFLISERKSLERGEGTRLYEVSSWSMLMAFGVEAYAAASFSEVRRKPVDQLPQVEGQVINANPAYGFLIDYRHDRAVEALLRCFDNGFKVRTAQKDFEAENRAFARGALLLRLNENPASMPGALAKICAETGVTAYGVNSALSRKGPDLGGEEFRLLTPPRIALLSGPSLNMYNVGALWYLLDYELKQRISILNRNRFDQFDLRKYNVLILPDAWGGHKTYHKIFGKEGIGKLKDWISDGGTLIGIESGAAFLADSASGISKVKLRRQALHELELYGKAVEQERQIGKYMIDSLAIWEGKSITATLKPGEEKPAAQDTSELKLIDERQRLFMPRGAILNVELDEQHWLSFGVGDRLPALLYSAYAYLSRKPVQTAGRFSEAAHLRLSGLMWHEARERWQNTAYLTRESQGNGQVILFAGEPNFRSYFYGTGRLLMNAMVLGPGLGTKGVVEW